MGVEIIIVLVVGVIGVVTAIGSILTYKKYKLETTDNSDSKNKTTIEDKQTEQRNPDGTITIEKTKIITVFNEENKDIKRRESDVENGRDNKTLLNMTEILPGIHPENPASPLGLARIALREGAGLLKEGVNTYKIKLQNKDGETSVEEVKVIDSSAEEVQEAIAKNGLDEFNSIINKASSKTKSKWAELMAKRAERLEERAREKAEREEQKAIEIANKEEAKAIAEEQKYLAKVEKAKARAAEKAKREEEKVKLKAEKLAKKHAKTEEKTAEKEQLEKNKLEKIIEQRKLKKEMAYKAWCEKQREELDKIEEEIAAQKELDRLHEEKEMTKLTDVDSFFDYISDDDAEELPMEISDVTDSYYTTQPDEESSVIVIG